MNGIARGNPTHQPSTLRPDDPAWRAEARKPLRAPRFRRCPRARSRAGCSVPIAGGFDAHDLRPLRRGAARRLADRRRRRGAGLAVHVHAPVRRRPVHRPAGQLQRRRRQPRRHALAGRAADARGRRLRAVPRLRLGAGRPARTGDDDRVLIRHRRRPLLRGAGDLLPHRHLGAHRRVLLGGRAGHAGRQLRLDAADAAAGQRRARAGERGTAAARRPRGLGRDAAAAFGAARVRCDTRRPPCGP